MSNEFGRYAPILTQHRLRKFVAGVRLHARRLRDKI